MRAHAHTHTQMGKEEAQGSSEYVYNTDYSDNFMDIFLTSNS